MSSNDNSNDDDQHDGSGEITSNKKEECTSCEQNSNVENITERVERVALMNMSKCASCGKEGNSDDMDTCNKCKMVKYCNAACKKKHRTKHKKACERRVAELHEEQLFKEPPPHEECPICLQILPLDPDKSYFQSCCGKIICLGCIYAMKMSERKHNLCAFCRTPTPSSGEEHVKRLNKLMDKGNALAISTMGALYRSGEYCLPRDHLKANELYLRAGDLGCTNSYFNLGVHYYYGDEVEVDKKKAIHYYELAAMGGDVSARNNLGCLEVCEH